jgi:phage tail-like protein
LSVDATEYREGTTTYTKKFPGIPKVGEISLSKGVARKDYGNGVANDFLKWVLQCVNGGASATPTYRADLAILEYHITDEWGNGTGGTPSKKILAYECFPTSVKLTGDKDASSSDIAITEMTLQCESVSTELIQN